MQLGPAPEPTHAIYLVGGIRRGTEAALGPDESRAPASQEQAKKKSDCDLRRSDTDRNLRMLQDSPIAQWLPHDSNRDYSIARRE